MIFPSLCILQSCKVLLLSNCQSVSNRLNVRQSKLFTECPQKVQLKRIGSIRCLVGNVKRLFRLLWICSRGILRNAPNFLTVGILSAWDRDRQSDHAIIENVTFRYLQAWIICPLQIYFRTNIKYSQYVSTTISVGIRRTIWTGGHLDYFMRPWPAVG